jgi:hypothetical protein
MLNRSLSRRHLLFNFAYFSLIAVLSIAIIVSLLLLAWLAWRQLVNPILWWDSFNLANPGPAKHGLIDFLLSPNNEHRIFFAKLNAFIDYKVLKLPPASTAMAQQFLVILLCSGLLVLIGKRFFPSRKVQILSWLSGTLLLLIPWQYENFLWEFQVPWLLTNAFLLMTTLALAALPSSDPKRRRTILAFFSVQPWLVIFNCGQGFALIAATLTICLLISRYVSMCYMFCAFAAVLVYILLPRPFNKPSDYGFDIDFASQLLLGGAWHGLAPLILLLVIFVAIEIIRQDQDRNSLRSSKFIAALTPGVFSLFFSLIVTVSRVNVSWGSPNDSRYATHMLMAGISALLITNLILEKNEKSILIPPLAVLLTTMFSFPLSLTGGEMMYGKAWRYIIRERKSREEKFACNLAQASLKHSQLGTGLACENIFPKELNDSPYSYFSGQFGMLPIGQHLRALTESKNILQYNAKVNYAFQLENVMALPYFIQLKGWAYDPAHPYERLFLIANYREGNGKFYAIQERRIDVMKIHGSRRESTSFSVRIPLQNERGSDLQSVSLAGPSGQKTIWSQTRS